MQVVEFVGQVQHGARLTDTEQAMNATRATLETLAERLGADESRQLAARLPEDIGRFLGGRDADAEPFSFDEFVKRISAREGVEPKECLYHARAVLGTLQRAVPGCELRGVLERLPSDYASLFPLPTRPRGRYGAGF